MGDEERGSRAADEATPFLGWLFSFIMNKVVPVPAGILSNLVMPSEAVLLPIVNEINPNTPHPHPIIQTLQKLELGKLMFTLSPTAIFGILFSQKFDFSAGAHDKQFIIAALMAAFVILWNGTLFRILFLELLGISLILLCLFGLVATFLSGVFSLACWICGVLCLMPFLYLLIKPQAPAVA